MVFLRSQCFVPRNLVTLSAMGQLVPAAMDQSGKQLQEQQLPQQQQQQQQAIDSGSIPVIIQQQDIPQPALDQSQMPAGGQESREASPPESNQLRYLLQRGPTEKSNANKVTQQQQAMVINTAAGSASAPLTTTTTSKLWVPGAKER